MWLWFVSDVCGLAWTWVPCSLPHTHQKVEDTFGSQGPVVHAQAINQHWDPHGIIQQFIHAEEVVLEDPLTTKEVQFPLLI